MRGALSILFALTFMLLCMESFESDYSYSLTEGSCHGSKLVQEDIVLPAQHYTVRRKNYSWDSRGIYRISCFRVTNNMPYNSDAAQVRLTGGGLGYDYLRLELISRNSRSMDYTLEIWGEEASRGSYKTYSEIYVSGERYCRC
ncbi:hypothetical protein GWI33_010677 [Rhynchophorus ferrugineus]|uniref:Uncharacterized protein n=1 Tax=Rhynchophorus ferrugineus TaxID=354439 RepID=A0A834IX03_RHYFE|nr:hypothetical protein GWI33_010677 [Rhynchophorus ferrugineus]